MRILSLPHYDAKTDSFTDGILPKSADSFFADGAKIKDFFEIKKAEHHEWVNLDILSDTKILIISIY